MRRMQNEEGTLQRTAARVGSLDEAPLITHEVLRSPGQPLVASTRAPFSSRASVTTSAEYGYTLMRRRQNPHLRRTPSHTR